MARNGDVPSADPIGSFLFGRDSTLSKRHYLGVGVGFLNFSGGAVE